MQITLHVELPTQEKYEDVETTEQYHLGCFLMIVAV